MIYLIIFFLCIIFLCWGSFLNVVAYRSVFDKPFFTKRSYCPSCNSLIFWYDNIPLISWLLLRGRCRHCKQKISFLYPFIEILTAVVMTALFCNIFYLDQIFVFDPVTISSFFAYFIFSSALIVSTRTDLEGMVIPQIFSFWLVPVGFVFSYFGFLKINIYESTMGAVLGYAFLWIIAKLFKIISKKEGLGVGDMELMALIGSFLGPFGIWFCLMISSFSGLLVAGLYLLISGKKASTRVPFAPFLVLGAFLYFFFESYLQYLIFGI
jgi:leader peptidase (prepilin peptidase) / N-methyltransferase